MRVKLISHTPSPDLAVYKAARTCYQAGGIEDIAEPTKEACGRFIEKLISSGHTSAVEHVTFTFAIEGISRVVSHELVRHRMASYSQQSQRYVRYGDMYAEDMYMPKDIAKDEFAKRIYRSALQSALDSYDALLQAGVKPQDARYVLPNAMPTQIVCTFNARSLINFFGLRCCKRAQPEMRELACEMLKLVKEVAPAVFSKAGARCWHGQCIEERKCI